MYKRVLVAVDGSSTSTLALREAIKLAKEQQSIVRLVHVVDLSTTYMDVETPWPRDEIQRAYREEGRKILKKAETAARRAGIQFDSKLLEVDYGGRITEAISDQAERWPADLIVIGTHGRRGVSHLLLGSVAEGVVRVATKPVLLIRGR